MIKLSDEIKDIIKQETNVDSILEVAIENIPENSISWKPNFKVLGSKYGKNCQQYVIEIKNLTYLEVLQLYSKKNENIVKNNIKIFVDDIIIKVQDVVDKNNISWTSDDKIIIGLDLNLDQELIERGFIAELKTNIIKEKKNKKLNSSDEFYLIFSNDCSVFTKNIINKYKNFFIEEVGSSFILFQDNLIDSINLEIKTNNNIEFISFNIKKIDI